MIAKLIICCVNFEIMIVSQMSNFIVRVKIAPLIYNSYAIIFYSTASKNITSYQLFRHKKSIGIQRACSLFAKFSFYDRISNKTNPKHYTCGKIY